MLQNVLTEKVSTFFLHGRGQAWGQEPAAWNSFLPDLKNLKVLQVLNQAQAWGKGREAGNPESGKQGISLFLRPKKLIFTLLSFNEYGHFF